MTHSNFCRLFSVLILVASVGLVPSARADTLSTLSLSSTLLGGTTADGAFVLDGTTGTFTSGEVTISYDGQSTTLSKLDTEFSQDGSFNVVLGSAANPAETFDLVLPESTLKGYEGSAIASLENDLFDPSFLNSAGFVDPAVSGVLTLDGSGSAGSGAASAYAAAQAPEVCTLLLVLTGLVFGMVLLHRQRAIEAPRGSEESIEAASPVAWRKAGRREISLGARIHPEVRVVAQP